MQATMWACYLWAYRQTGFELFLQRAKTAIGMTMAAYPDHWVWMNGIQQERAKMLLPLAWLVRVEDTPEHRAWLRKNGGGLAGRPGPLRGHPRGDRQGRKGRVSAARLERGLRHGEAPLIQTNGDAASDLLYTCNFAFLGLHEAAAATGDPFYREAEEKLAKFLCRIQIRSETHPELDGGWFRAFDFKRWEYWASNADAGWGAWCIESGWTQSWITAVLALRQMNTSLWDMTKESKINRYFAKLRQEMLPDEVLKSQAPKKVQHAALAKPVKLAMPYSENYPANGAGSLTDGLLGGTNYLDPAWLGFLGNDLVATIDLGDPVAMVELRVSFCRMWRWAFSCPARSNF